MALCCDSTHQLFELANEEIKTFNFKGAYDILTKASDLGCTRAKALLAYMLLGEHIGVEKDEEKALALASEGAEKNCPDCKGVLGFILLYSWRDTTLTSEVIKKGYQLGLESTEGGSAHGMFLLGRCFLGHTCGFQDYVEAAKWFSLAAEKGHDRAALERASMYFKGDGGPRDVTMAIFYYKIAIDHGNSYAAYSLGSKYLTGDSGVPQDKQEAIKFFRIAYPQPYAVGALYNVFERGDDTPLDDSEALFVFTFASPYYAYAQFQLGRMYEEGHGVEKSDVEAVRLYHLAAEQGHAEARSLLLKLEKN